jgi:hypothetical protein
VKNEGEKDFMGRNLESNTTACGIKVERIAIAAARNANKAVTHCFKRDGPCITHVFLKRSVCVCNRLRR